MALQGARPSAGQGGEGGAGKPPGHRQQPARLCSDCSLGQTPWPGQAPSALVTSSGRGMEAAPSGRCLPSSVPTTTLGDCRSGASALSSSGRCWVGGGVEASPGETEEPQATPLLPPTLPFLTGTLSPDGPFSSPLVQWPGLPGGRARPLDLPWPETCLHPSVVKPSAVSSQFP